MGITIDQASLGTFVNTGGGTSSVLTTTNAVASGALIIVVGGFFDISATTTGITTSTGLTGSVDKSASPSPAAPQACHAYIGSIAAPSGMASSATITVAHSANVPARTLHAFSILGADTSGSRVDGTPVGPTGIDPATTGWTTPSYSIAAGSIIVAICWRENGATTADNTITNPSVETSDVAHASDGFGHVSARRIESSAGSYTVAGSWGTAAKSNTIAVAYKAAASGTITHNLGNAATAEDANAITRRKIVRL